MEYQYKNYTIVFDEEKEEFVARQDGKEAARSESLPRVKEKIDALLRKTGFKLKNYSTAVPADRSIAEVEDLLVKFGAQAIMKTHLADGRCNMLAFKLDEKSFRLPANVEGVHDVLFGHTQARHGVNQMSEREAKSYRVAWRIIRDWLHAQLSLIASGQAAPEQILLPYMFDGKRTLYEAYKDGTLRLGESKEK
jgi:hypothetical protein